MQKIRNYVKTHKKFSVSLLVIIILICIVIFKQKNKEIESYTVERSNIEQTVALSGKVETSAKADLGFASAGRIGKIFVKNNQNVSAGQTLVQLEIGELLADLKIKEANLRSTNIDLEDAKAELEKITLQEDAKVANAYRTLLSEDLVFTPNSVNYTVTPPTVSGIYNGAEGIYKISIKKDNPTISNYTLRTFNLESTEKIINEEAPTVFGTKGLYISFSDDLEDYVDTTWYLEIPNKSGSSYLSNYNNYIDAKNARDLAIKDAKATYDKILTEEGDMSSSIAQAEIDKIRAEIRKNTIYAPFDGVVTNIEKEIGENASVGERVISVLGAERLEVVLQVSELDVSKLIVGTEVLITLDALPGEEFKGTLKNVNSRETTIDGVPVYEAFVELDKDDRVRTGMSAGGLILLNKKDDVIAIPNYYIEKREGKNYVSVLNADNKTEEKEVVLGILGSDSQVEILSGLDVGEKIIAPNK